MIPGRALHRLASRICSAKSLERVVEPAIADLQKEYADAIGEGRVWHGRWILVAGYVGCAEAVAMCGFDWMFRSSRNTGDERHIFARTLVWGALLIVAMTAGLMIPPLQNVWARTLRFKSLYLMALIPQALPLAIPVGLTLGVLVGFDGKPMTYRHRSNVLVVAVACALMSFAILCWIMPANNQAFRVHVAQANGLGYPVKGENEMTIGELSREIHVAVASGLPSRARNLAFAYHLRWSLACGVIALVVFASAVAKQGFVLRFILGVLACGVYWILLFAGDQLSREHMVSALFGAWLPNLVFVGMSAGLLSKASGES